MFGFKRKQHVHNYEYEWTATEVTMYQVIKFFRCKCGAGYVQRFYYQGPREGDVEYEKIGPAV